MFVKHNNNPKQKKTSDCVIRSFALASGKTWDQTFVDLCEIALRDKSVPNDNSIYSKYATQLGLTKMKIELTNGKKPTVLTFSETHKHGTYVLRIANHVVTVKDGCYYDTWDCGKKSVYMYWKVNQKGSGVSE